MRVPGHVVLLLALLPIAAVWAAESGRPEPDAFYAPPERMPARPGVLLRSEPFDDVTLPAGTQAWRIQYTTSIDDRTPATAVAIVIAPKPLPPGPRPVIVWAHGTTGVLQRCMPSMFPAPAQGIPAIEEVTRAGWVIVATDYAFAEPGGPSPYLVGEGEARSVLDSLRAAHEMADVKLQDGAVVWGHSQGGHAALWTGAIAKRYAPELKIRAIAAIAPATDIKQMALQNPMANKALGPYIAASYARFQPGVGFDAALQPSARRAARKMKDLCAVQPQADAKELVELAGSYKGPALALKGKSTLAKRLDENRADRAIPMPLLVAQGGSDAVVLPAVANDFIDQRCDAGQRLQYWTFAGQGHDTIVQPGSPLATPLMDWTRARFEGEPVPDGCGRESH